MALNDDDVREILRLIDESGVEELRIETDGLRLHVRRGGAPAEQEPPVSGAADAAAPSDDGAAVVTAPMLGTFYAAQSPSDPPFVEVGTRVAPDTVVGLIEVMKLMNAVQAGVSGTVVEVCAANAQLVEYGQAIVRVAADR